MGNPFSHLADAQGTTHVATRAAAINQFEEYARGRMLGDEAFRAAVLACRGKVLGCWCTPKACHGEVILRLAHEWYLAHREATDGFNVPGFRGF